jgi:CTP:molybdopterin cytidylyltransferase MocA
VLAAGRGERYAAAAGEHSPPKALLEVGGKSLLARALAAASGSGLDPVVVVVSDDRVAAAVPAHVRVVRNEQPERGISSSLHAALRALDENHWANARADDPIEGVVVGLADQPLVGPQAYRRVADAYDDGVLLAVATYGGVRGNPVLLARQHWREALTLTGDEGARVLLRRHGAVEVPCDGTGEPTDVDTPEDLARLETRWRSKTAFE